MNFIEFSKELFGGYKKKDVDSYIHHLQNYIVELEDTKLIFETRVNHLENESSTILQEKQDYDDTVLKLNTNIVDLENALKNASVEYIKNLNDHQNEINTLKNEKQQLENTQSQSTEATQKLMHAETEIIELRNEISRLSTDQTLNLESELSRLKIHSTETENKLAELKAQTSADVNKLAEYKSTIATMQHEIRSLRDSNKQYNTQRLEFEATINQRQSIIEKLKSELESKPVNLCSFHHMCEQAYED